MREVTEEMKKRRANDSMEEKFGWYYRHWKSGGINPKETKTHSLVPWDEQCAKDPVFIPKVKNKKPKVNKEKEKEIAEFMA